MTSEASLPLTGLRSAATGGPFLPSNPGSILASAEDAVRIARYFDYQLLVKITRYLGYQAPRVFTHSFSASAFRAHSRTGAKTLYKCSHSIDYKSPDLLLHQYYVSVPYIAEDWCRAIREVAGILAKEQVRPIDFLFERTSPDGRHYTYTQKVFRWEVPSTLALELKYSNSEWHRRWSQERDERGYYQEFTLRDLLLVVERFLLKCFRR